MPTRLLTDEGSFSGDSRRKINAMFAELYLYAASGQGGSLPTEPIFETITVEQDTISVGGHTVQVTAPVVLPQPPDAPPANVALKDAPNSFSEPQTFDEVVVTPPTLSVGGHVLTVAGPATIGGGPAGVTAGPFTAITSIQVVNGLVTAITGT